VTATGPERTAWSCVRRDSWGLGKASSEGSWALKQTVQGSGHSPEKLESVWTVLSDTGFEF